MNNFEQDQPLDAGIGHEHGLARLQANETVMGYWREIAGWCYLFGGIYLFLAVAINFAFMARADLLNGSGASSNTVYLISMVYYLIMGILYLLVGKRLTNGVERVEEMPVEQGFRYLFIIYGVSGVTTLLGLLPFIYNLFTFLKNISQYGRF
jgi:hypothetical protein